MIASHAWIVQFINDKVIAPEPLVEEGEKWCKGCETSYPLMNFYMYKTTYRVYCKECYRLQSMQWRHAHQEQFNKGRRAYRQKLKRESMG